MNTTATRLAPSRYIGYGLGDFAFNFYWKPLSVFLLIYYTDVLGLASSTAGTIIMVCLLWDGFIDPFIGIVSNKTRSRFGRYRPYMLFGCVPLAVSFALMFFPVSLKDGALIAYVLSTQLLFRTMYAAVNIPYGAMMASMTRDSMERNWLAGVRMVCAFSGSAVVGYFTPRLVAHFEGSAGASAYFIATAILSGISIVVLVLCFAFTEEHVQAEEQTQAPVLTLLKMIASNTPFLQAMCGIALFSFANVVVDSSLVYFIRYHMHQDQSVVSIAVGMTPFVQMLAIIPWTIVNRYLGKRWAWITGLAIAAAALLSLNWMDSPSPGTLYAVLVVYAVGCASIAVNFWSIVPDTVEYGEWRTGLRAEGFIFGFVTLIQKVALGLSSAFVGMYLGWVGYVANQAQSAETLAGLKLLLSLIAVLGLGASCIVMYFYRLDSRSHADLVSQIAARQQKVPALS